MSLVDGLLIAVAAWAALIVLICVWFKCAAYHDDDLPHSDGDDLVPPGWACIDSRADR